MLLSRLSDEGLVSFRREGTRYKDLRVTSNGSEFLNALRPLLEVADRIFENGKEKVE
jgi:DNA-binding PadR family transcriptional regulator